MRAAAAEAPRVLLAAATLESGRGGVATVARLMLRALERRARAGELSVRAISLLDSAPAADFDTPHLALSGSRARFVFHAHRAASWATHLIFDCSNMARARPRLPGLVRPGLVYLHGIEIWESAQRRWVEAARRSSAIVANSRHTLARAEAIHGCFSRAEVCPLALECNDAPTPQLDIAGRAPRALIVGRVDANENYKGHRELIEAWPRVAASVPGAELDIVGGGSGLDALKAVAARSPARERIHFHGFTPNHLLEGFYSRARVFAMPSRGEGFGIVYLEAMRAGLPALASVHDAAREVVRDGETGFTVNLDGPDELPQRLIQLLTDDDLARRMGAAGRERWLSHYTRESFERRFDPILDAFLAMR